MATLIIEQDEESKTRWQKMRDWVQARLPRRKRKPTQDQLAVERFDDEGGALQPTTPQERKAS